MATQTDIRQEITNQIVDSLKQGSAPWRSSWIHDPNAGSPTNVMSQRRYRGINPIVLELSATKQGFHSKWWGTFAQWKSLGAWIKKGSKATQIVFCKSVKQIEPDLHGKDQEETYHLLRTFAVFNAEQSSSDEFKVGHEHDYYVSSDVYEQAETVIHATNADIRHGGNKAFYDRAGDFIQLPFKNQFTSLSNYYSTTFHELMHWSESRLGWNGSHPMGELIAEMGSCFIATELRIPQCDDYLDKHTGYLAHCLTSMQNDPNWIFKASSQASKASDFILAFKKETKSVHETEDVPF